MQLIRRQVHIAWRDGPVESIKNTGKFIGMFGDNAFLVPVSKNNCNPLCLKDLIMLYYCNL